MFLALKKTSLPILKIGGVGAACQAWRCMSRLLPELIELWCAFDCFLVLAPALACSELLSPLSACFGLRCASWAGLACSVLLCTALGCYVLLCAALCCCGLSWAVPMWMALPWHRTLPGSWINHVSPNFGLFQFFGDFLSKKS